jgi:hypothetical protein
MNHDTHREETVDDMVNRAMKGEVPAELQDRLHAQLGTFRGHVAYRESMRPRGRRALRVAFRTASAIAGAAIILGIASVIFGTGPAPTWADVLEQFESTPFVNATIYVKSSAVAEPVQLELWLAQGGKLRLRAGNQVVFGEKGRTVATVPLANATDTSTNVLHARQMVQQIVDVVAKAETFSFDTLVQALPFEGTRTLSAPLANQNASVSNDLIVFDIACDQSPEWVRIWALRESRLPVRFIYWDPRSAASVDVSLSYGNRQPPEFFDPAAFRAHLAESAGGAVEQAYGLLRDSGGRPLTPQDVPLWREGLKRNPAHSEAPPASAT